jgi:hypothetical protein
LREQFARVHAKLDRPIGNVDNLIVHLSAAVAEAGDVRVGLVEANGRLDSMDRRPDRIEPRLELTGARA